MASLKHKAVRSCSAQSIYIQPKNQPVETNSSRVDSSGVNYDERFKDFKNQAADLQSAIKEICGRVACNYFCEHVFYPFFC